MSRFFDISFYAIDYFDAMVVSSSAAVADILLNPRSQAPAAITNFHIWEG